MGNEAALGQIFQVVTNEYMTWNDVLLLYSEILHKYSYKPVIYLADDTKEIDKLFEGGYQMPYDIMYNRRFHSAKYIQNHTNNLQKYEGWSTRSDSTLLTNHLKCHNGHLLRFMHINEEPSKAFPVVHIQLFFFECFTFLQLDFLIRDLMNLA